MAGQVFIFMYFYLTDGTLAKWVVKMLSGWYWFQETSGAFFWSEKVRPLKVSESLSVLRSVQRWCSQIDQSRNILIHSLLSSRQGLTLSQYGTGMRWRETMWNTTKSESLTAEAITSPQGLSLTHYRNWWSITQVSTFSSNSIVSCISFQFNCTEALNTSHVEMAGWWFEA